jgi:hypothetical protein
MPLRICRLVAFLGVLAAFIGMTYNFHEAFSLPHYAQGERPTVIDLGRGPKVYGTTWEATLNQISNVLAIGGIFLGVAAIGIGIRYFSNTSMSNQSTDPTLASGTPRAGHESRHP